MSMYFQTPSYTLEKELILSTSHAVPEVSELIVPTLNLSTTVTVLHFPTFHSSLFPAIPQRPLHSNKNKKLKEPCLELVPVNTE